MAEKPDEIIELKISCRTWLKETEDLYDFETSNISTNENSITNFDKDHFILKYKTDSEEKEKIDFINKPNILKQKLNSNESNKVLGMIKFNKLKSSIKIINSFKSRKINNLKNIYTPEHCERIYEIFPIEEYININEGDIIKVGKVRIKFDKISFKSKNKSLYEIIHQETPKDNINIQNNSKDNIDNNDITANKIMMTSMLNSVSDRNTDIKTKPICRLCYLSESSIEDPLISPCNCSGSMKYIHLSCLKNNIKFKCTKKCNEYVEMFLFKSYACEICLTQYPKFIAYKTQIYYLFDLDLNKFENYVLCDLTKYIDNNNNNNNRKISRFGYLMFKVEDNKELNLGRKKNNTIKLKDISISRSHCLITKKGDNLMIKDLGSKFGTMRYIKDYCDLQLKQQIFLSSGKHEFEFTLDKTWKLNWFSGLLDFWCCTCKQPLDENAEIIMVNDTKTNSKKILDEEISHDELSDKNLNKKINYFNKFKDDDSYNDYIIKLDNILGLDNSLLDNKKDDIDENENENINSQNKDKDESFTNY